MLWRLLLKLLFKVSLPLLAIVGVMTYGVYLRGGDPGALWVSIADRSSGQFGKLWSGAGEGANVATEFIAHGATGVTRGEDSEIQRNYFYLGKMMRALLITAMSNRAGLEQIPSALAPM